MNHSLTHTGRLFEKPELLSPAGDMEKLKFAVRYGADAVYLAAPRFGMRGACGNFSEETLADAVREAHAHGVRVYVTLNTMPRSDELAALPALLAHITEAGADAVIVADLGVLSLVRRHAPNLPVHISTQTSIVNYESARMWHTLGASRIVLARELSLDEIADIRAHTDPSLEIECFVHGAMCISYSGRCVISNYLTGRDANRGQCAQPCRWEYRLVEEKRPGQYLPVFEDERGTYLFNSRDLCMIEHIPALVRAGIGSFKIEGRVKTAYYAAVVTSAYRRAIDGFFETGNGWVCPPALREEVERVSHRDYYTGFYLPDNGDSEYREASRYIRTWDIAAVVDACEPDGQALLTQKNKFSLGDALELLMPDGTVLPCVPQAMENEDGAPIESAPHPCMRVRMRLPCCAPPYSILRRPVSPGVRP